jgi:hydrogenase maturation protease
MAKLYPKFGVPEILVIGYGNDLRSDDGAGRVVASRIEAADHPDVTVRSQSQLTPELALDITRADVVVFVDANVDCDEMTVHPVESDEPGSQSMSHHTDPAALLLLARDLGRVPPDAYVVSIPATSLELGFELSSLTASAVEEAVSAIEGIVESPAAGPTAGS